MAFREKIVPNLRGEPRTFEPVARERRDPAPQLTAAQKERAYRYAREHRVSVAEAVRQLFGE
jgi:hypothetical protein